MVVSNGSRIIQISYQAPFFSIKGKKLSPSSGRTSSYNFLWHSPQFLCKILLNLTCTKLKLLSSTLLTPNASSFHLPQVPKGLLVQVRLEPALEIRVRQFGPLQMCNLRQILHQEN